jgi:hypothetical protein
MANKNMRNIFYAVFMTVLVLLMVVSTTIASAIISSNAITFGDDNKNILGDKVELDIEAHKSLIISEDCGFESNANVFTFSFGFIIIDAIMIDVVPENNFYVFL